MVRSSRDASPSTFADVIDLWGRPGLLAEAIEAVTGHVVEANTISKWRQRDFIPPEWWVAIVQAAGALGKDLTATDLARIAARPAPAESRTGTAA